MSLAGDALALLARLDTVDAGDGVIVYHDDVDEDLLERLREVPGILDCHRALGTPRAWHVLVLPRGRRLAAQHQQDSSSHAP